MIVRGEFFGWIQMNIYQYTYSHNKTAWGFPNQSTIQFINSYYGTAFLLFLVIILLFSAIIVILNLLKNRKSITNFQIITNEKYILTKLGLFSIFSMLGVLGMLYFTHMWPHHLQPLSLAISMGILPILKFSWNGQKSIYHFSLIAILITITILLIPSSKTLLPLVKDFQPRVSRLFDNQKYWPENEELNKTLDDLHIKMNRNINYVVLQQNTPGYIAIILPDYMKFNCVFLDQYPMFGPFKKFSQCIDGKNIDIIFKFQGEYSFDMPDLVQGINVALHNFHKVSEIGGYDIYVRNGK